VYGLAAKEQKVLLARVSGRSMWPGTWWLPGGGINFGETPTQCLVREFEEEAGLLVTLHTLNTAVSDMTDLPGE
jgi:ADP-ribose pyrophosphatase YjhB (NUDIX family)